MEQKNDGQALLELALKQKDPAAANELLNRAAQTVARAEKALSTVRRLIECLQKTYTLEVKSDDEDGK